MIVFLERQTENSHNRLTSKYSKSLVLLATAGGACQKMSCCSFYQTIDIHMCSLFLYYSVKNFFKIAFSNPIEHFFLAYSSLSVGLKNWFIGKDPDDGKDWGQEEKGATEEGMVGWHQWLSGHEFEQTLGDREEQGSLPCCSPWGHKESDTT